MARNEEKQQGRLNRLWLQKEREVSLQLTVKTDEIFKCLSVLTEGRIKDVHKKRPRLSALTSASSVKKWIPSIKSEIEYYLQQSQLTHYPERKINEFQLHIESLEREYKSFISKLRVLDPTCKHTPWVPRAYCKRRADPQDGPRTLKSPGLDETKDGQPEDDSTGPSDSVTAALSHTKPVSESVSEVQNQDLPLTFDPVKLSVCVAAFRRPQPQQASSHSYSMTQVLQAGLPNLNNSSTLSSVKADDSGSGGVKEGRGGQKEEQDLTIERTSGKCTGGDYTERTAHVLGLECYSASSSDADDDEGP